MIWILVFLLTAEAFTPFRRDARAEDMLAKLRDETQTKEPEVEKPTELIEQEIEKKNNKSSTTKTPEIEEVVEKIEEKLKTTEKAIIIEKRATTLSQIVETSSIPPYPKCQDQFSRCFGVASLCSNRLYEKIMVASCAKTCGFCREFVRLPTPERCRDLYPEECKSWGDNGFCHAYFYTMPEKVENCMKTCGLC